MTSTRTYVFLTSLVLVLAVSTSVKGQKVLLYPDSASGKFRPAALHLGADLIGLGKTFVRDDLTWLNFYAGLDLYKYTFNLEYGRETRTLENTTSLYEASGNYFRIGPDINFLFRDPDASALYLGARYARSTFSDKLDYAFNDPFWGISQESLENESLSAGWAEVVAGMRVKLFQAVWFGFTGRFKFAVTTFEENRLIPSHVPGYGRADLRTTWEFNYWLIFRLPLYKPPYEVVYD